MVNDHLYWVRVEGTDAHIRKFSKDARGRVTKFITSGKELVYVAVPGSELGWLDKVAQDDGCKKRELPNAPEYQEAACGELVMDNDRHKGRCRKCQAILYPNRPVKATPVKVVGKLEPGPDMHIDLESVMKSLEATRDKFLEEYTRVDEAVRAVKLVIDSRQQLSELKSTFDKNMAALKTVMNID